LPQKKEPIVEAVAQHELLESLNILMMYPIDFDDHELYSDLEHVETMDLLAVTAQADCTKCSSPVGKDSVFSLLSLIYGLLYC
jgi:hypothetical protein